MTKNTNELLIISNLLFHAIVVNSKVYLRRFCFDFLRYSVLNDILHTKKGTVIKSK